MKKIRYIWVGLLLIALTACGLIHNSKAETVEASNGQTLEVHYIDVGQGDATLVKLGKHAMLIDAGPEDSGTKLQSYLQKQKISSLDYLILTHPDADHIGGGDVILTKFDCEQVMMSSLSKDTASYRDIKSALKYRNYQAFEPTAGSTYKLGDAEFTIVGPTQESEDANNSSISLLLTYGDSKFLFTGDAQEEEEADILASKVDIEADVYQAGHHGSKTSSSEEFMQAVNPTYAVISCQEGNSYGHPHAEVLNRFRSMRIKVFRTDEQGSIIAYSDKKNITWNASPSESWQAGEPQGTSNKQKQEQVQTQEQTQPTQDSAEYKYVLNTNTHKFHRPNCSSVDNMAEKNKQLSSQSRDEIIAQGYAPCKRCKP